MSPTRAGVVALAREDADGGVEDQPRASPPGRLTGQSRPDRSASSRACNRSPGMLVVDLTATCRAPSRRASCCGSARGSCTSSRRRAIRCARWRRRRRGRSTRARSRSSATSAPGLAHAAAPAPTSCSRASGPASRRGSGSGRRTRPRRPIYCSITGYGAGGRHEKRAGHDLNYLGWAGVLDDARRPAADADRRQRRRLARRGPRDPRGAPRARAHRAGARGSASR